MLLKTKTGQCFTILVSLQRNLLLCIVLTSNSTSKALSSTLGPNQSGKFLFVLHMVLIDSLDFLLLL